MVISGPSGVGKDATLERMHSLERLWHFVVTVTTRPIRRGEINGRDYIFVTAKEFEHMLKRGEFLEHATVYGYHYGVLRTQIRNGLDCGKDVILKVDVQGVVTLKRLVTDAIFVFIVPPSLEELTRRLQERSTEGKDNLNIRLKMARQEMEYADMFDYLIVNETQRLPDVVACIDAIIIAEKCRFQHREVLV